MGGGGGGMHACMHGASAKALEGGGDGDGDGDKNAAVAVAAACACDTTGVVAARSDGGSPFMRAAGVAPPPPPPPLHVSRCVSDTAWVVKVEIPPLRTSKPLQALS